MEYCRILRCFHIVYRSNFRYSLPRTLFYNFHQNRLTHAVIQKTISSQINVDLRRTEITWKHKNRESMQKMLYELFSKNEGSVSYIVDVICGACHRCEFPSDLVFTIVSAFNEYLQLNNISYSIDLTQKVDILRSVLSYKNYHLLQFTCRVFRITEQAQCFKDFIQELIHQHKLIEAAFCVSALHLQEEYAVEKLLLPLLLEGKVQPGITYMTDNKDLQLEVVKKFDALLGFGRKDFKMLLPDVSRRKVLKTLSILVNAFNIDTALCKNLFYIRSKGAIIVLIQRRKNQSVSEKTWEEMTMNVVGVNEELKKFLIQKLIFGKDIKTALKMAKKLNISDADFSAMLSEIQKKQNLENGMENNIDNLEDICEEEDVVIESNHSNHLMFSSTVTDIELVADQEKFIKCMNDIKQNYNIIGIDSEWKPHFGLAPERLSLIQLAVHDKVFILDMLALNECIEVEHWNQFMDDIFGNPNIIKLGCGIISDIQMILQVNKGTEGKRVKVSHLLDMAIFYQKLQEVYPEEMGLECENKNNTKGLSKLCEILLGKPLNKEERLCDWEKRPLKDSQLEYAALDAHCLLQMYDKLKEEAVKKDMNFNHLCKVSIVSTHSLLKPKKGLKVEKSEKTYYVRKPIHIEEFKVIVQSSLESLGKKLRQFGADVVILDNSNDPEEFLQISKAENRIIICTEELWKQVLNKVPDGFCFNASLKHGEQVTASHILLHFNVQFNEKNIYSRCMVCNSENNIRLTYEDLQVFQGLLPSAMIPAQNLVEDDNFRHLCSELQEVIKDMSKYGVHINHNNLHDILSSENRFAFLCKKCGYIQ